jgi:hypothetical protein
MRIQNREQDRRAYLKKEALSIPYISPVSPNTLPVEAVLVRGSQKSTQEQSTMLLRTSGESADKPEQLLRAFE